MHKCFLIGYPLSHSLSPQVHQLFARQTHIDATYDILPTPPKDLTKHINYCLDNGIIGVNITLPHKEQALQFATQISKNAQQAQATNALYFAPDGKIIADNFDGAGLIKDLTDNHNIPITQKKILLIGAGGAARGIIGPLLTTQPNSITITNRTFLKAKAIANHFKTHGNITALPLSSLKELSFDIIIHASSAGLSGTPFTPPSCLLQPHTVYYDMMYGSCTPFTDWAQQQNIPCIDGIGMLVEQAAATFQFWHNVSPNTQTVIEDLRKLSPFDKGV